MGRKAAETTCNINNTFGQGSANERTVQRWFKKFCKGDESLEDKECSGQPSDVDSDNWEPSLKPVLWQLHEKLTKNSTSTILMSCSFWSKLERWKSSLNVSLNELTENQKNHHFEVSFPLILGNNKSFFDWIVTDVEKWILYNWQWPVHCLDREAAPKHFPKPNLHQKKVMVTVWWSAACLTHYSFLNPDKTITSEVCLANQRDAPKTARPAGGLDEQNGPNSSPWQHPTTRHTTNGSKVEQIALQSFASSTIFNWPLANQLLLLQASQQLFAEKKLSKSSSNPEAWIFTLQE